MNNIAKSFRGATFLIHTVDRPDQSRNATWAHAGEKKRKKEKKLRDVKSHVCAQTTHVALPPQSCHVGCGPGRVNHARFRQNWL